MKKSRFTTVILILLLLTGLSLVLYPTVSDYVNSLHQSRVVAEYTRQLDEMDPAMYEQLWDDVQRYNEELRQKENRYEMTEQEKAEYEELLNISGNGMIGSIEIPSIKCSLPIYHGSEETVLQVGAGHIESSSLPAGGEGTHCVLSGHRGLPSAKLFTDLDKLTTGDRFTLKVLDREMTYEVDQILVVEPEDISALEIEEGKDYCTLVTCTPYGINTHRLLVRGHRVEGEKTEIASQDEIGSKGEAAKGEGSDSADPERGKEEAQETWAQQEEAKASGVWRALPWLLLFLLLGAAAGTVAAAVLALRQKSGRTRRRRKRGEKENGK